MQIYVDIRDKYYNYVSLFSSHRVPVYKIFWVFLRDALDSWTGVGSVSWCWTEKEPLNKKILFLLLIWPFRQVFPKFYYLDNSKIDSRTWSENKLKKIKKIQGSIPCFSILIRSGVSRGWRFSWRFIGKALG